MMSGDFRVKVFVGIVLCTIFMVSSGSGARRQRRPTDEDHVQINIRGACK